MSAHGRAIGAALLVAGTVCACAPSGQDPGEVARAFYDAVGEGDGTGACELLAPVVAEAVADEAGASCGQALVTGDVGADLLNRAPAGVGIQIRVAGRQAQVRTAADTLFLARSGDTWVITAAACEPRPDRPYDCEVSE